MVMLPKLKDDLESTYFLALMDFLKEETKAANVPEHLQTDYMLVTLMKLIVKEKTGKQSLDGYVIFKANEH